MERCVLIFLFLTITACSVSDRGNAARNTRLIQDGELSTVEWDVASFRADTLDENRIFDETRRFFRKSADFWIFEAGGVSIWGINGDIPDEEMFLQPNSIAIVGENAPLPKVFALQFSRIISVSNENLLIIVQNYRGILMNAADKKIILTTDGVCWYE
jgi:hypothetical protein